jgi:hypothetical protein
LQRRGVQLIDALGCQRGTCRTTISDRHSSSNSPLLRQVPGSEAWVGASGTRRTPAAIS